MKKIRIIFLIVMILSLIALIYYFLLPKYRITFKIDNEIYYRYNANDNSLLRKPKNPSKSGYEFIGWYKDDSDLDSSWNFSRDRANSNIELTAKFELKIDYIEIKNIKIEDTIIKWDEVIDAKYQITFLNETHVILEPFFDLVKYRFSITKDKEIIIKPIKDNYEGIETKIVVNYKESKEEESYFFDFESVSKIAYEPGNITYGAFEFTINNGIFGSTENDKKIDKKSLRLREKGFIENKNGIRNFRKITFSLSTFGIDNESVVMIYFKNKDTDWQLVSSVAALKDFRTITIDYTKLKDIDLSSEVFFMIQKDATIEKVNIDNLAISTIINEKYSIKISNEYKLLPYYHGIENLKGEALVKELRLILSTNIEELRYEDARLVLQYSDVDATDKNAIVTTYTRQKAPAKWIAGNSGWVREHIWPSEKLGIDRLRERDINQAGDLHNIRAAQYTTYSIRQSRYYVQSNNGSKTNHTVGRNGYYPGDIEKGDIARILLYMAVRYDFLMLTNEETVLANLSELNYKKEYTYSGKLNQLIEWHNEDLVDDFERNRNEVIYDYQRNRNPFIDHPELFDEVFKYFLSVDSKRKIGIVDLNYYYIDEKYRKKVHEI